MKRDLQAVKNFDFLARSFAHMQASGQQVNLQAVTGNMSHEQKMWFCERFNHYCIEESRAAALEH